MPAPLTVTSQGRNKNCRFRLDFSMMSMSVTVTAPLSPQPRPIMAKFLSNSQPMAPAPTYEVHKERDRGWLVTLSVAKPPGRSSIPSIPLLRQQEGERV